jgi:hypothetical protein
MSFESIYKKYSFFNKIKNVFRPNVKSFDICIKLKTNYCPNAYQCIDLCEGTFLPHYKDFNRLDNDKTFPIVDFDIVKFYVNELRRNFSDVASFFYDEYGSAKIYAIWKKGVMDSREIKLKNVRYNLHDLIKNKMELNVQAIVEDFKMIGKDLFESIDIKNLK